MKRKIGLALVFGAALPLAIASVAWACGILATLSINTKVAAPGQTITVTGKNYGTAASGASAVSFRLKSRNGTVLTQVPAPAGTDKISATFAIPANTSPGWYVLLATQNSASGVPKTGTPGRTTVRIQGAAQSSVVGAPWGSPNPSGPSAQAQQAGGGSLLAILFAGALSLSMLAGGWTLLSRRGRTSNQPQFSV
jgi:hypothetical protein